MIDIMLKRDHYSQHREIYEWCETHFGVPYGRWHRDIMFGTQFYKFVNDEDATFFALRWGNE